MTEKKCGSDLRKMFVMAGLDPRLSGLFLTYTEAQLANVVDGRRRGVDQVVDGAAVHEVGADQSGEGKRTFVNFLGYLSKAEQQEGDQCNDDLDADRILVGADEVSDPQSLLDPAEEQLDGPAPAVQVGDLAGAGPSSCSSAG